jgi:AAA+ ATPase superfamily predicted ATPase
MKLNKAPGLDGLSVEFYRKFWNNLKILITTVFNFNYERGQLSNSQKIGTISLIFQKNYPLSLGNYRPITLLNTDTKNNMAPSMLNFSE